MRKFRMPALPKYRPAKTPLVGLFVPDHGVIVRETGNKWAWGNYWVAERLDDGSLGKMTQAHIRSEQIAAAQRAA